jgi:hypothetical protein
VTYSAVTTSSRASPSGGHTEHERPANTCQPSCWSRTTTASPIPIAPPGLALRPIRQARHSAPSRSAEPATDERARRKTCLHYVRAAPRDRHSKTGSPTHARLTPALAHRRPHAHKARHPARRHPFPATRTSGIRRDRICGLPVNRSVMRCRPAILGSSAIRPRPLLRRFRDDRRSMCATLKISVVRHRLRPACDSTWLRA